MKERQGQEKWAYGHKNGLMDTKMGLWTQNGLMDTKMGLWTQKWAYGPKYKWHVFVIRNENCLFFPEEKNYWQAVRTPVGHSGRGFHFP